MKKREKTFIELKSPCTQLTGQSSDQASGGGSLNTSSDPDHPTIANTPKSKVSQQQYVKFLDLSKFKVEKCRNLTNGKQHNHKHCRYYHTIKDKRRLLDYSNVSVSENIYTPDLCDNYETESCPSKERCLLSHNRVESVYHPEKYKTKYCTKYPKNLSKCEYGDYCSFAHSTKELKTRLIHQMKKDADFFMFYFKTECCPFNKEHNKA